MSFLLFSKLGIKLTFKSSNIRLNLSSVESYIDILDSKEKSSLSKSTKVS